ncbi:cytochrome c oxidase assembly protein [Teichococcus oryzae]|nr:cytochrome c oxidase assembly protein [Pseudoroseomonas oryzae]
MRGMMLGGGVLVLALAWGGPVNMLFGHGFTAGMTTHMAVVAVAAPLLAVAILGTAADPLRRLIWIGPLGASLLEFVAVWGWHLPVPHNLARHHAGFAVLEQFSFLVAGLLLWLACLQPGRQAAGIIGLLLTSMHMTLLGVLLTLAPRPLYDHGHGHGLWLSAQDDQALGGVVMLLVGGTAYLAGGVALAARLMNRQGDAA